MYVIRTIHGNVKCDYDELVKITEYNGRGLVYLRSGAVNPAHITIIDKDVERMEAMPKLYGETEEDRIKRIRNEKSEDIFGHIRSKTYQHGE